LRYATEVLFIFIHLSLLGIAYSSRLELKDKGKTLHTQKEDEEEEEDVGEEEEIKEEEEEEEIDGNLSIDLEADLEKSMVIEEDITWDKDNVLVI
jgi:hypothetical protein